MRHHDDTDEIMSGLLRNLESLLSRYWPGWIKNHNGKLALLTPKIRERQKKPTSSFQVDINGSERGRWYRHSQKTGGGNPVSLIFYAEHDRLPSTAEDWREAYNLSRAFLGMRTATVVSEDERREREHRRAQEEARREREHAARLAKERRRREYRALTAASICEAMLPILGTKAESYLVARGIPPVADWGWSPNGVLGFVEQHEYESLAVWEDGRKVDRGPLLPALIARVQDPFGDTIAVWQIFLDPRAPRKNADVPNAKMGLGSPVGGAVRIGGMAPRIGIAEGLETTLGAWFLEMRRMPVWAALSAGNLAAFEPPLEVSKVDIYPDGDKGNLHVHKDRARFDQGRLHEPTGYRSARQLAERLKPKGLLGFLNSPPLLGDSLDLWNGVKGKINVGDERQQPSAHGPRS